jgi:hypothetical protein
MDAPINNEVESKWDAFKLLSLPIDSPEAQTFIQSFTKEHESAIDEIKTNNGQRTFLSEDLVGAIGEYLIDVNIGFQFNGVTYNYEEFTDYGFLNKLKQRFIPAYRTEYLAEAYEDNKQNKLQKAADEVDDSITQKYLTYNILTNYNPHLIEGADTVKNSEGIPLILQELEKELSQYTSIRKSIETSFGENSVLAFIARNPYLYEGWEEVALSAIVSIKNSDDKHIQTNIDKEYSLVSLLKKYSSLNNNYNRSVLFLSNYTINRDKEKGIYEMNINSNPYYYTDTKLPEEFIQILNQLKEA